MADMARQGELLFEAQTKLRGNYPDIPLSEDIRDGIETLSQEERVFVTIPLMKVGSRSRNERTYSRAAVEAIQRAINENHTTGITGHLNDAEYSYAFDFPTLRWLGARMVGDTLWGKCLICTPAAREYIRFAKATHAKIGTSIYGWLTFAEDGETVTDVVLESLDLVDPVRVGVLDAVAAPVISAEMHEGNQDMPQVEELTRQRDELQGRLAAAETRLAELESAAAEIAEVEAITRSAEYRSWGLVVAEISASLGPDADAAAYIQEMYAAMRAVQEKLGIDGANIVVKIDEYQRMEAEMRQTQRIELDRQIDAAVAESVKLEILRPLVRGMIGAAETKDAAVARIGEIVAGEAYINAAAKIVQAEMGPGALVPAAQGADTERAAEIDRAVAAGTQKAKTLGIAG